MKAVIIVCILLIAIDNVHTLACFGGRIGCIASCQVQNCATGNCHGLVDNPAQQTCVCIRCANGAPSY